MKNQIILFTKQFPYGHEETYLFDELEYLKKTFQTIYIVPYDEYTYIDESNRLLNDDNIKVIKLNTMHYSQSILVKIKREFYVVKLLFLEIVFGREKISHIKRAKKLLAQLRHLYSCSVKLSDYFNQNITSSDKIVAYNYWLHRGVIISQILKQFLHNKIVIVSRAHAYDLYHKDWLDILNIQNNLFLPFEYLKIKFCDKIFSISTHGLKHFTNYYGHLRSKFEIARLGVKDYGLLIHDEIKKDSKIVTVVTCSGIDERKRIYLMPEILSNLNFDFRWIHFGYGNLESTKKLKGEIEKYKLEHKCLLKGLTPHHEIIDFYLNNSVDLIMNLSTAEGIPVSLMEAASFSIPMLATNTVGNPEIVNNENGFIIEVDFSTSHVSNLLNNYFSSTENIKFKELNSRAMYNESYNAEKNYTQFANYLASL